MAVSQCFCGRTSTPATCPCIHKFPCAEMQVVCSTCKKVSTARWGIRKDGKAWAAMYLKCPGCGRESRLTAELLPLAGEVILLEAQYAASEAIGLKAACRGT